MVFQTGTRTHADNSVPSMFESFDLSRFRPFDIIIQFKLTIANVCWSSAELLVLIRIASGIIGMAVDLSGVWFFELVGFHSGPHPMHPADDPWGDIRAVVGGHCCPAL